MNLKHKKYIESAILFFKKQYGLSNVSCTFKFIPLRHITSKENQSILGTYCPRTNEITIYGVDHRDRNSLVKTVFHELFHYLQFKVEKTLQYIWYVDNNLLCNNVSGEHESLIKDYYHYYAKQQLFYQTINTESIYYYDKPHEIEARARSKQLFEEWNRPKHKGKCS